MYVQVHVYLRPAWRFLHTCDAPREQTYRTEFVWWNRYKWLKEINMFLVILDYWLIFTTLCWISVLKMKVHIEIKVIITKIASKMVDPVLSYIPHDWKWQAGASIYPIPPKIISISTKFLLYLRSLRIVIWNICIKKKTKQN